MASRRHVLGILGGACAARNPIFAATLPVYEARDWVRSGRLGLVPFCRVGHPDFLSAAQFVLGDAHRTCSFDVHPAADGVTFLGTHATLAVTRAGCRLYARE